MYSRVDNKPQNCFSFCQLRGTWFRVRFCILTFAKCRSPRFLRDIYYLLRRNRDSLLASNYQQVSCGQITAFELLGGVGEAEFDEKLYIFSFPHSRKHVSKVNIKISQVNVFFTL